MLGRPHADACVPPARGSQETRLGSYNNYTNLEQDVEAGMKKLEAMWGVCGQPPRVRGPPCRGAAV
jgi:hypothetical protein